MTRDYNAFTCYDWLIEHKDIEQDECLIWPFARKLDGYGYVKAEGKMQTAHRVMCKLKHGPPPEGKPWALHSCNKGNGTHGCVNPNHLHWGNNSENQKTRNNVTKF